MENKEVKIEANSFFKKNKKMVIVGGIALVLVIALATGLGISYSINSPSAKKAKMEESIKELGKDFYENFYYDIVVNNNGVEQISKFNTIGIKVNLDNLQRYKNENADKIKEFVNPKTNEECNKEETKVIIYPQDPYGKENYNMEVQLSCGFDEK